MKITTELFDSLERHNKIELPPAEKRLVRHSLQAIVRSLDVLKEIAVPEQTPEFRLNSPREKQREDAQTANIRRDAAYSVPSVLPGKGEDA